jgi:hypothetical protein
MNNLPLISHHLFVAAAGHEEQIPESRTRRAGTQESSRGGALPVPLEVMAQVKGMAATATRPLRSVRATNCP